MAPQLSHSFTVTARNGILRSLCSECLVCPAFEPADTSQPPVKSFTAIWDTGATGSTVNENVIQACGLQPVSMAEVSTAGGKYQTEVYLVAICLPNGVAFPKVRVTRAPIVGADVLIGMDIIGRGDFAVTNFKGQTKFTFRVPSMTHIDFVKESRANQPAVANIPRVGRNDPCPCKSGSKYKKCCGRAA